MESEWEVGLSMSWTGWKVWGAEEGLSLQCPAREGLNYYYYITFIWRGLKNIRPHPSAALESDV